MCVNFCAGSSIFQKLLILTWFLNDFLIIRSFCQNQNTPRHIGAILVCTAFQEQGNCDLFYWITASEVIRLEIVT